MFHQQWAAKVNPCVAFNGQVLELIGFTRIAVIVAPNNTVGGKNVTSNMLSEALALVRRGEADVALVGSSIGRVGLNLQTMNDGISMQPFTSDADLSQAKGINIPHGGTNLLRADSTSRATRPTPHMDHHSVS